MELRKYFSGELTKLLGPIFLILSEFFPWFSDLSLFNIFLISSYIELENAFLYLFPLISGALSVLGLLLYLRNKQDRIKYMVISLIGIGFLSLFFIELIPNEEIYLQNMGFGFYICIIGFVILILSLVHSLIIKNNES